MLLNQLFDPKKLFEGGNLSTSTPGWMGVSGDHEANEIELKIHNRSLMVGILDKLLSNIDHAYTAQFKSPLWNPKLLQNKSFLSGSSLHFFNVNGISDDEFTAKKPKVGDIDTQVDATLEPNLEQFFKAITGKQVGNAVFLGYKYGNNQFTSLWELKELPIKVQIDFEFGKYDPKTQAPDEWFAYSHSSEWNDVEAGIKGVFHKYLNRALAAISSSEKYVARVLKKGVKISPEPVTDNDLSFAVSGPGGGGMSRKYVPYIDPSTGEPMMQNGIPVMRLLEPKDRDYIQNLDQQFQLIYGRKAANKDKELMKSFLGTLDLMNKYVDEQQRANVVNNFLDICFGQGAQMLTKDDPSRDREAKFAAVDSIVEKLKLPDAAGFRQTAIQMAKAYEDSFKAKKQPIAEAEVQAQLRKGMPHLHDLKAPDFLDLLDEIHDGNGRFKLENIPLNVKVDGFGGRFGKDADGRPFMGTSRTPPRYEATFLKYHQEKGTTDPEILGRAQMFDDLFKEMMNAINLVDNKLGPKFLINKQVTCEVLFLPFATETPEGRLKFVGIQYDKLPKGVELALVPFHVVEASSGEAVPGDQKFIDQLLKVGQQGSVMFINNRLTQNEGLDVTEIINVLDNIEELKQIVADTVGKRDRVSMQLKKSVEEQLQPIKEKLEQAIINDPNIIGKDMLGKDYEGIVINSRLGPIKITSQEQRDVIQNKQDAMAAARTERPRSEAKTAVVAIGSFIGHKGHEELFSYTINKAKELGGDPYLFIGNAEGKDDPIPPAVKVQTWHKLYPEYANNISTVQQGGSLIQKVKHELINPLPGKPPRYDNIIIMVGEDRAGMNMPNALMKAVNKFQGYEHVKVSLEATPRGTGISGTMLRNSLKKESPEQALTVWSNAFDVKKLGVDWIKHLMDITRKGMGIQMPQQQKEQPAPVAERLLNALIRTQVDESTSVDSSLKIVINDIGEPITAVYDKLKFMAKRYVHDHGELNRGWKMVEMGEGARWVQNMYNAQLKGALYALTKYIPKRTGDLQQFLAGREVNGEIEMKRSFNNISNELPEILAKVGNYIESPELSKAARRWMQNKTEYENYLSSLEDDDDEYDSPSIKPEKSKLPGQQNAQADQIVNNILKKLPSKIAGDIRNAIARTPNKLQSLQSELQKRGVSVPMAESIIETAKMSAAVRLQKALQREKEKSDYSRRYAEKHFPIGKPKEEPKKQDEGLGKHIAGAALAGAMALGGNANAQSTGSDQLPDIVAHVTFTVNGNTVTKDFNLGTKFSSPKEASEAVANLLKSKGIGKFDINIERVSKVDELLGFGDKKPIEKKNIKIDYDEVRKASKDTSTKHKVYYGPNDYFKSQQKPTKQKYGVAEGSEEADRIQSLWDRYERAEELYGKNDPRTRALADQIRGAKDEFQVIGKQGFTKDVNESDPSSQHDSDWVSGALQKVSSLANREKMLATGKLKQVTGYKKGSAATADSIQDPNIVHFYDRRTINQGVAEALTYPQKHSSWSVRSPKKNEFNTRYKLDQEPEARAHAERIGGKLVKVDQRGHAIRTGSKGDKGVAEGSLEEVSQDTARSYAQKAQASQKDLINQTYRKGADTDALNKKIKNRQQGMDRACTDKRYYKDELGVAEGSSGAKYKVRSIGKDKKGEYYVSPSTGEKVYKKARVGDHEVPNSKEIKPKVAEAGSPAQQAAIAISMKKAGKKPKYEAMLPASSFVGSNKNKLGSAGQLKGSMKRPARAGDLVGGAAESIENEDQRLDPHCWKGYRKAGTKMKGGTRVNNCVPVREDVEDLMAGYIKLLENK